MADLTITAANVVASANAKKRKGTAGATVTAGQVVYEDTGDSNKFKLADADGGALVSKPAGIALHGAANGQPLEIVTEDDDFTPGATLSLSITGGNGTYVLSDTPGGIMPHGDLDAGDIPTVLFVAKDTTKARLKIVQGVGVMTA